MVVLSGITHFLTCCPSFRREDTGFGETSQLDTIQEPILVSDFAPVLSSLFYCRLCSSVLFHSSVGFCIQSDTTKPSSGLLQVTTADSTLPEMRESASLEMESSVSAVTPKEPERAATMPAEALRAQTVLQEGMLGRKHDVDGTGKKASNRLL